jgi:hypothetical protein
MYDPGEGVARGGECPLNMPAEGLASRPALHFDHRGFEARELALMALLDEAAGGAAEALPDGGTDALGTVVAAALEAAAREAGDL